MHRDKGELLLRGDTPNARERRHILIGFLLGGPGRLHLLCEQRRKETDAIVNWAVQQIPSSHRHPHNFWPTFPSSRPRDLENRIPYEILYIQVPQTPREAESGQLFIRKQVLC